MTLSTRMKFSATIHPRRKNSDLPSYYVSLRPHSNPPQVMRLLDRRLGMLATVVKSILWGYILFVVLIGEGHIPAPLTIGSEGSLTWNYHACFRALAE